MAGLVARPLEMTPQGVDLVSLERVARAGEAKFLYVVPTLQNPTTVTMPRDRREAIVDIARRYNLIIIEDDLFRLLDKRAAAADILCAGAGAHLPYRQPFKDAGAGLAVGFVAAPRGKATCSNGNSARLARA